MRAFAWFLGSLLAAALIGGGARLPCLRARPRTLGILAVSPGREPDRHAGPRRSSSYWLCRHLGVRTKRDVGFGLPWRRFLKVSLLWGAIGIVTASVGRRFPAGDAPARRCEFPVHGIRLGAARTCCSSALSSGIAVALIEETVMRGAMHTAIERESGAVTAALLTAPLFAVLHFFAKAQHSAPIKWHWRSGFDLLVRFFAPLGHPALVFDAFLAWLAVGLILSLTRVLTGNIAVSDRTARRLGGGAAHASGGHRPRQRRRVFGVGRPLRRLVGLLAAAVGGGHRARACGSRAPRGSLRVPAMRAARVMLRGARAGSSISR